MSEQADRWTGRTIDNRYIVESTLGQGGMGVVLRAKHKFTGAQVALKMLLPDMQLNEDAKGRFLAEARTPTTIGHPGIVQVMDAGETPEGELYLAMELLEGRTLRQAVHPPMSQHVARRIILEVLDAVSAAHARGIIHRDLKPENVYLCGPTEKVKLLDFGIAKVLQTTRTAAGAVLGTVTYMAPEQLTDASTVDARADLWAVGVMFYELLCGRLPFPGTTLGEIVVALSSRNPDPIRTYLPSATPPLEQFFARALAKDRTARFGSAQELALAVSAVPLEGTAPGGPSPATTLSGYTPRPMMPSAGGAPHGTPSSPHAVAAHPGTLQSLNTPQLPKAQAVQLPPPPASPFTGQVQQPAVPFVQPPGAPIQWNNSWSAPVTATKPPAAGGSSHLLVIVGALGVLVAVIVLVMLKVDSKKKDLSECEDICKTLGKCGVNSGLCETKCVVSFDKARKCIEDSNGSCDSYNACTEKIDRERHHRLFGDDKPDKSLLDPEGTGEKLDELPDTKPSGAGPNTESP